jgi:outer membrane protein assembly factor BamB
MGGELSASPVADSQGVYVASEVTPTDKSDHAGKRPTGRLRALGHEGGVTQWEQTVPTPLRGALTLTEGTIYGGGNDGKLYAFDSKTGQIRWAFDYSAPFNCQPVVSLSRVYVGSEDGALIALDRNTGRLLWRYRARGAVRGPVATANETVYFGAADGYVYALNSVNGKKIWRTRTGAGVQAVVRVDETLLVASLDNFVYLFTLKGARVWKRQMPGRLAAQPLTASGAALFTPLSSSEGIVLGLHDGRPVNSLPTGEEITTSAAPIAVGDAILLTTEHGLLAFAQPNDSKTVKIK